MAHDTVNEFMNSSPAGPEVIKPHDLMSILNSFHYSLEKVKYLIDKNNYLVLHKIKDATLERQSAYFQRNVC